MAHMTSTLETGMLSTADWLLASREINLIVQLPIQTASYAAEKNVNSTLESTPIPKLTSPFAPIGPNQTATIQTVD